MRVDRKINRAHNVEPDIWCQSRRFSGVEDARFDPDFISDLTQCMSLMVEALSGLAQIKETFRPQLKGIPGLLCQLDEEVAAGQAQVAQNRRRPPHVLLRAAAGKE